MTLRLALKMHLDVHGWQWCRNQRVWPNTWDSQGSSFSLEWGVMVCTAMCVLCLVAQSCPALCNPLECSPPGSSVHGDSPGKNTGVGCHAPSRGYSQSRDQIQISCIAGGFYIVWATREVQEYWSRQFIPSPGDFPDPGIQLVSPALQVDSLPAELPGKPIQQCEGKQICFPT